MASWSPRPVGKKGVNAATQEAAPIAVGENVNADRVCVHQETSWFPVLYMPVGDF